MAQQRGRSEGRRGGQRAPARAVDVSRLRAAVADVVTDAGYDLEDLGVKRLGRRYLVRLAVDSDAGVDLDGVATLSREVSRRLDEVEAAGSEIIPGEYELEVGSPGIDRPLTLPRHWRRNRGRLVRVRAGGSLVEGRVSLADDAGVVLDTDGEPRRFGYSDLGPGRVQVEFTRAGEPSVEDDDPDGPGDFDGADGWTDGRADGIEDEGDDEE